ncbi:hypothetical protein Tco_0676797 [Tanacetum coccineum]
MLTKPQFFYDHTTKQALGFQNPFYLKKAQQLEPKLYVGDIIEKTNPIVIPDSEETLLLAEESRSKMLLRQKDPIMLEKKVNTTPVDYAALNQLYKDFETRFVPQTELSAEQAFWSQNLVNSPEPILSSRPTIVEVPKELPKVSMVNTSLKKLKHHLAGFDVVVKERTTPTTITEGSWGFEHTKACFRDEIIPFVKALKDLFNTFNQYLVDELSEVQNVFHQMEQAVEQHRLESKTFEVKMNQVLNENERLLEQVLSKDIVNIIVNSSVNNASVNVHECEKCLQLETELQTDFIEKEIYDKLFKSFTTLEKHCISLEVDSQLNQEIFQRDNPVSNQSAPSFDQLFELNELKAQSQEKDTVIKKLKERIKALSMKKNEDMIKQELEEIETINIELDHRVTKLIAENEHLKQTYKQLYDSIKPAPLKNDLRKLKGKDLANNAVTKHTSDPELLKIKMEPMTPKLYTKLIQELLTNISRTCPNVNNSSDKLVAVTPKNKDKKVKFRVRPSTSASGLQPSGNTKKDKFLRSSSSTLKNKVEAHSRTAKTSLKNKNSTVEPKGNANVKHSKLNTNSKPLCVKPTGRTFTIIGNACPLTRITTTTEVPLRKPTALENETPKLVVTLVYSRKPRKSKTNVPDSKSKEMNEQVADASKKRVKKDDNIKGEIKEEEGTRKRKIGIRKKMKSKKRMFTSKDDEDYDETEEIEDVYLNVVIRSNRQRRYFSTLMAVLSILDRDDICAIYQLVMNRYQDKTPKGFDKILWGDLIIISSGIHTIMTNEGIVIHMLVENKYPLKKEVLSQLLKLKLETEEDSTMALELIRFVKNQIAELEPEDSDGDEKDL